MDVFKGRFVGSKIWILQQLWRLKYIFLREKLPTNADGKVYVNLGCGVNTSSEFINVDAVPQQKTHFIADIQKLFMFPDNSVDLIYASHVIEHLPRTHLERTLKEWLRALKPGGVLRFGVPNFDALIEMYKRSGNDVQSIVNQLLGQDGEYDDHHTIWNRAYAEKLLTSLGFEDVREWNPDTVEHHDFHDKTNRKYDTNDGAPPIPFSLNLEAAKPLT